jgi:hypothetical protein
MQPALSAVIASDNSRDPSIVPAFTSSRRDLTRIAACDPHLFISTQMDLRRGSSTANQSFEHQTLNPLQSRAAASASSRLRFYFRNPLEKPIWIVSAQISSYAKSLQAQPATSTKLLPSQTAVVPFTGASAINIEASDFPGAVIVSLCIFLQDPDLIETIDKAQECCYAGLLFPLLVDDNSTNSAMEDALDVDITSWSTSVAF